MTELVAWITLEVPAAEVRVGDRVLLPQLGPREVIEISRSAPRSGRSPGPRVSIAYRVVGGGSSFEDRATRHGRSSWRQSEQLMAPLELEQLVAIEREWGGPSS